MRRLSRLVREGGCYFQKDVTAFGVNLDVHSKDLMLIREGSEFSFQTRLLRTTESTIQPDCLFPPQRYHTEPDNYNISTYYMCIFILPIPDCLVFLSVCMSPRSGRIGKNEKNRNKYNGTLTILLIIGGTRN